MDLMSSVAEGAGAAVVNKLVNRKKRDNIFTRLFGLVKMLLDDPEKMELRVTVEDGKVVAKIKPDKEKKSGIILKVATFEES